MSDSKPQTIEAVNHLRLAIDDRLRALRDSLAFMDDAVTCRTVLAMNLADFMAKSSDLRSQIQLGKRSGIAQATIGRILRCEVAATVDTVEALANALGVQPFLLLHPNPSFAEKEAEFYARMRSLLQANHNGTK